MCTIKFYNASQREEESRNNQAICALHNTSEVDLVLKIIQYVEKHMNLYCTGTRDINSSEEFSGSKLGSLKGKTTNTTK